MADPAALTQETSSPEGAQPVLNAERKDQILSEFKRRLRESATHRSDWMDEAKGLYDLAAGRQWDAEDKEMLDNAKRPCVTFNVSGKYLDALTGLQINNRQDIRYAPREAGDQEVNELLTGAVAWGRDLSGMADDETDSFYDCVLTGEGWMEGFINRDLDPAGVPCGERVDPLEMFPDPVSRKRNYEDARYLIRLKWISQDEYDQLTKGVEGTETSTDQGTVAALTDDGSDQLQFIETPHDYGDSNKTPGLRRLRPLADYQWFEREDSVKVSSNRFGEHILKAEAWNTLKPQLQQTQQQEQQQPGQAPLTFTETPFQRRVYYRAIIAGGSVLKEGLCPHKTGFTFHAITGKRDRNKRLWYGIGRALVDPQKWTNKFFSSILFTLMTNAKGGVMAEENSFVDQRKAEDTWSAPDSITMMKAGAVSGDKVREKPQTTYPTGMQQLMEFSLNALPQTSGLNLELLGLADRQQAGVVEAQRKQSAMAIVAWAFDGMRRYYRNMGRMLACYVKDFMEEGTLIRIEGDTGAKYVPLIKKGLSTNFDVVVDEAPTSVNQQERVWAVLTQLIPQLLQAQIPIPPTVIKYAPLPAELQQDWQQLLQPDPKKTELAEQTAQATVQKAFAEVADKNAHAALEQAQAGLATAQAAQINAEVAAGPAPGLHPQQQMALEGWKSRMQGVVDAHIAQLKANKDQETKLILGQMDNASKEHIATVKAMIDAAVQKQIAGPLGSKIDKATARVDEAVKTMKRPRKIKKDAEGNPVGTELA